MKISAPLPTKARACSESLDRETDPELRAAGYLRLAATLDEEERWPAAAEIYARLLEDPSAPPTFKTRAQSRLALLQGHGAFGQRFESWLRSFVRHAADPASLAAMTAGGLAYRAVRLGVAGRLLQASASPWTRGLIAQTLATGSGFGAEVFAFTALGRGLGSTSSAWSQDLSHAALSLGALKLSGAAGSAIANRAFGAGLSRPWAGLLLQQTSLLGGILLGAQLEKELGWRERRPDSWEALATLLHFNVGARLSRNMLGERFAAWENRLDRRWQELPWRGPHSGASGVVLATAGSTNFDPAVSVKEPPTAPRYFMEGRSSESGLTPPAILRLETQYLRLFPSDEEGYYSREIVARACRIRCSLPSFHENLLEALLNFPKRGQLSQLHTVLAIERIFNTDALGSSRGSFSYAPLQMLLGHVLSETETGLRQKAMVAILNIFERGFSRGDSAELLENFTRHPFTPAEDEPTYDARFHALHGEEAGQAWKNYRPQDMVPLFNFVHREAGTRTGMAGPMIEVFGRGRSDRSPYYAAEIDAAIDYARFHPYGDLVLRRLYHILEASDHPSKLLEIGGEPSKIPTDRYVKALTLNGHGLEDIADTLNGGVHTAYFNDMRLAEKVVSVFQEVAPFLESPQLREQNKANLVHAMLDHAILRNPLRPSDLFQFLHAGHYPAARFFERAWLDGQFSLEILPEHDFRREVQRSLQVEDCEWSLYQQAQGRGGVDRILIRELPELKFRQPADRDRSFSELVWRLRGLVHELEHWRHFRGVSPEGSVPPFELVGISREERLITEIMAYMEEFGWRAMNSDDHFLQIARRLGDTLALYLRNVAEQSYF